jgi:hypothetical protein
MSIINGRSIATDYDFGNLVTRNSGRFFGLAAPISAIRFVPNGILRAASTAAMMWLYHRILRTPVVYYGVSAFVVPFLLLTCLLGNVRSFYFRSSAHRSNTPSSLWMVVRPGEETKSLPDLAPDPELYMRADRYKAVARPVRERASFGERV